MPRSAPNHITRRHDARTVEARRRHSGRGAGASRPAARHRAPRGQGRPAAPSCRLAAHRHRHDEALSDSYNYLAHERASKRMELEFGQNSSPASTPSATGKKQPEFPRQELTQDEDQQQKRTGLKRRRPEGRNRRPACRRRQRAGVQSCPGRCRLSPRQGRPGYIIVDETGGHSVVSA